MLTDCLYVIKDALDLFPGFLKEIERAVLNSNPVGTELGLNLDFQILFNNRAVTQILSSFTISQKNGCRYNNNCLCLELLQDSRTHSLSN